MATPITMYLITQITSGETEEIRGHIIHKPDNILEPYQYKSVDGKPGYYPQFTVGMKTISELFKWIKKIYAVPFYNPHHYKLPLVWNKLESRQIQL